MLLRALALLSVAGPSPSSGPATPAPMATRYKVEMKSETTIDLSVMGAPVQIQTVNLSAWLMVRLADSAGGRALFVKVDSMTFDGTAPVTRESLDSVKGAEVHGFVNGSNKLSNLTVTPSTSVLAGQIQGLMHNFFPRVKARAKVGDTWMDTTTVRDETGGNNTTTVVVTSYTAGGVESQAGIAAVKFATTGTSTVTGTLESPATGTMELEGSGSSTGMVFVGPDGRLLRITSSANHDQRIKLSMAPALIPVKTVQTVTVTLLP